MGKTQFNQKLCGVLDITQIGFNWEFCHAEFNNRVCPSASKLPGCDSWPPARIFLQTLLSRLLEEEGKEEAWNTPLVKKEIGKLAGERGCWGALEMSWGLLPQVIQKPERTFSKIKSSGKRKELFETFQIYKEHVRLVHPGDLKKLALFI